WQLIEKYRGLVYAMAGRNQNAVVRVPLRLYKDGSRGQGGPPTRHADPIKVTRSVGRRLAGEGKASPSAVDKIYEIRQHPIIDRIDNPDPYGYFTRDSLLGLIIRYCDTVGSTYLFPDWDGWNARTGKQPNRVPDYLWVLYSQYVLPIRMAGNPLINIFQYFAQGIPFSNVMWFRQNVSLRDPYGGSYSPTYAGTQYSDQEEKQIAIYDQVLGLGPRPNMMISAKDPMLPLGEYQAKRLEQDMIRRHAGGYAGGVLVVRDPVEVTPMSYSPADLAGKEISEYDRCNMAAIFGQPATYYTTDTNLANLQAADLEFARNGIDPRCKMVANGFTALVKRYDPTLFFGFDPTLPEDEELKEKVIDMKLRNGSITVDQANEETQWPPLPDGVGAMSWIEGTRRTPQMIIEEHEQAMATQQAMAEQTETETDNADMPQSEQFKAKAKEAKKGPDRGMMELMVDRALDRLEMELAETR